MMKMLISGTVSDAGELRHTPTGKTVLGFTVKVEVHRGGDKPFVSWIDCSMWGGNAERYAGQFTQGRGVTLMGDPSARAYESKGETRAKITLTVNDVSFHDGKAASPTAQAERPPYVEVRQLSDLVPGDDIPF